MKTLTTLALALTAGLAFGDIVTTADGRKLEGKVKDCGDEILLEGKYGSTRLRKSQVLKIEYGKTDREEYAAKAASVKADDAAGHWALALWCKEKGLEAEYRKEAAAVLAVDETHEAAHLALGHQRIDGKWMSSEEMHLANGEVKREGKWVSVDESERLDAEDRARELLRAAAVKDAEKAQAAIDELVKLRADALLAPCVRALGNSSKEMRRAAWHGVKTAFDHTAKHFAIVRDLQKRFDQLGDVTQLALREEDEDLRALAIEATRAFGDHYAQMWYRKRVVEEDGWPKVRAAEVLGDMNDSGSVPYLMAAFYTLYIEVRVTNAQQVQDITDSFVDFIADPERRVITQPLRIETPKLSVQRVKSTVAVPEGYHAAGGRMFGAILGKMTGEKHGDDFEAWNKWYQRDGKAWVRERAKAK